MIYKLTKKDKNTIRLYNLGLTVDKLAKHFKISKFAVYKRLRKLHKNSQIKKIGKYWGVPSPGIGKSDEFRKPIRLHALQYEVRILSTSKTYKWIYRPYNLFFCGKRICIIILIRYPEGCSTSTFDIGLYIFCRKM